MKIQSLMSYVKFRKYGEKLLFKNITVKFEKFHSETDGDEAL